MAVIRYHAENEHILQSLDRHSYDHYNSFHTKIAAERLHRSNGFERLISLDNIPLRLYEHQRHAVLRVLRHMRGRAVLADEVGLGKTIEAGVILREYFVRGLVQRVLVLTPAVLVQQWLNELGNALHLPFTEGVRTSQWNQEQLLVASIDRAKQARHAVEITNRHWDMVIVDEAHHLKNDRSLNWRFVNAIQRKYMLLLTATPIQNNLRELYNLITLLKPGQLYTYSTFRRRFTYDRHSPKNVKRLRSLLDDVMVRTSRRDTLLRFPKRHIYSMSIPMNAKENRFYDMLVKVLRTSFHRTPKGKRNVLPYILLLRQATSVPSAAVRTLQAMCRRQTIQHVTENQLHALQRLSRHMPSSKIQHVHNVIQRAEHHIIVFTAFQSTVSGLAKALQKQHTVPVIPFHGGLSAEEKQRALQRFRTDSGVLVSTDTGSEGVNMQFCNTIVNYDLPWNPLRLEQRIGRVHRLGQKREVHIYNMAAQKTVEQYIMYLLDKKIAMFTKVVGELEAILSHIEGQFDHRIAQAVLNSDGQDGIKHMMAAFGNELEQAARHYNKKQKVIDTLLHAENNKGAHAHRETGKGSHHLGK